MLQEPPDDGEGWERSGAHLLGRAITVAKRHAVVLHADDAVVRERHAEDVRSQIFQRGCATPNRPTVHDPCLLPRFTRYGLVEVGLLQGGAQLGSKQHCQWLGRDQEGRIMWSTECAIRCACNRGHEVVDMRVK